MVDPKQTNSSVGTPARIAEHGGSSARPDIGDAEAGKRIRQKAEERKTQAPAPEARGGAGTGR